MRIEFRHHRFDAVRTSRRVYKKTVAFIKAITECYVMEDTQPRDDAKPVSYGRARCSVDDPFQKETGREVALRRAVMFLPKEDQGRLLKTYYSRRNRSC